MENLAIEKGLHDERYTEKSLAKLSKPRTGVFDPFRHDIVII